MSDEIRKDEVIDVAIAFLEELRDVYSKRGCEDWEFPNGWTVKQKRYLGEAYHDWNRSCKEDRQDDLRPTDSVYYQGSCAIGGICELLQRIKRESNDPVSVARSLSPEDAPIQSMPNDQALTVALEMLKIMSDGYGRTLLARAFGL